MLGAAVMTSEERRSQIITMLEGRLEYLNASRMAEKLGVSLPDHRLGYCPPPRTGA